MNQFMQCGGVGLLAVAEQPPFGQSDVIGAGGVIGLIAAPAQIRTLPADEAFDVLKTGLLVGGGQAHSLGDGVELRVETVDLVDVEDGIALQEPIAASLAVVAPFGLGFGLAVVDREGGGFSLPHLAAEFGRLTVGHPGSPRVARHCGSHGQHDEVDALIGLAGDPLRSGGRSIGAGQGFPGLFPGHDTTLEAFDDRVSDPFFRALSIVHFQASSEPGPIPGRPETNRAGAESQPHPKGRSGAEDGLAVAEGAPRPSIFGECWPGTSSGGDATEQDQQERPMQDAIAVRPDEDAALRQPWYDQLSHLIVKPTDRATPEHISRAVLAALTFIDEFARRAVFHGMNPDHLLRLPSALDAGDGGLAFAWREGTKIQGFLQAGVIARGPLGHRTVHLLEADGSIRELKGLGRVQALDAFDLEVFIQNGGTIAA